MKERPLTIALVATLMSLLVTQGAFAQMTGADTGPSVYEQELQNLELNRDAVVLDIVEQWRETMDALDWAVGWDGELTAALQAAPADKVLAVRQARTYDEVGAILFGKWEGPDVMALEQGISPPAALGSTTSDLVYTPLTPCRIIDTRFATNPLLLGRIGPNTGKQFQVNLSNFASQGGFAGSCGIPTSLEVTAVVLNVTSTDQTGLGNLRAIQTGGGLPTVSLVNYQAGVNIANSGVVTSRVVAGDDIYIYSGNSQSHVVVDLMGYFAAPTTTALQNVKVHSTTISIAAGATGSVQSPTCPTGYTITGGGGGFPSGSNANTHVTFLFPFGGDGSPFTTYNCGGYNGNASSVNFLCISVCSRVPGR